MDRFTPSSFGSPSVAPSLTSLSIGGFENAYTHDGFNVYKVNPKKSPADGPVKALAKYPEHDYVLGCEVKKLIGCYCDVYAKNGDWRPAPANFVTSKPDDDGYCHVQYSSEDHQFHTVDGKTIKTAHFKSRDGELERDRKIRAEKREAFVNNHKDDLVFENGEGSLKALGLGKGPKAKSDDGESDDEEIFRGKKVIKGEGGYYIQKHGGGKYSIGI